MLLVADYRAKKAAAEEEGAAALAAKAAAKEAQRRHISQVRCLRADSVRAYGAVGGRHRHLADHIYNPMPMAAVSLGTVGSHLVALWEVQGCQRRGC